MPYTSAKASDPGGVVPNPIPPSQKLGWGEKVAEPSAGLLPNHPASGEKQRKGVSMLQRKALYPPLTVPRT